MALTADEVVVTFRAEMDRYKSELRSSTALFEQATNRQAKQIQHLESQIKASSGQIGSTLKGLAAGFATAFSVQQLVQFADGFTRIQNALKITGLEGAALTGVQDKLFASAQKFGAEYESIAGVYSKGAQAANELGASQEQLLQFTDAVGAALKVQGGSAAASQGALLQLGQALGAGVVRAEEFNSIIEGAYPLAQAAARGIDGYGGSVAKLRAAIADGKVTSEQFFQGILVGSTTTIAQAEGATLTLAGAMTTLQNAMVQYVGGASSASGASAAFANGIALLAENIDTVANALAVIAVVAGSRYVAAMVAATSASVAKTIADIRAKAAADALAASQARATGILGANSAALNINAAASGRAAVAMGLVTTAGRGLMAVLGGPVGVALAAVTIGLGYMAAESAETAARINDLEQATADYAAETEAMKQRAREAGIEVKGSGDKAKYAADVMNRFVIPAVNALTGGYLNLAAAARLSAVEMAKADRDNAYTEYLSSREKDAATVSRPTRGFDRGGLGGAPMKGPELNAAGRPKYVVESAETRAKRARYLAAGDRYEFLKSVPPAKLEAITNPSGGAAGAPAAAGAVNRPSGRRGGRGGGRAGPTGPTRAELDLRAASEQRALDLEILRNKRDLADNARDRFIIDGEILQLERAERQAQLDANKDLTKEQRASQQKAINELYGVPSDDGDYTVGGLLLEGKDRELIKAEEEEKRNIRNKLNDYFVQIATAQNDANDALLRLSLDEAETKQERYDIERALLMNAHNAELAAIENSDLDEKIKEAKRKQLNAETELAKNALDRAYESPMQKYARDVAEVGSNLNDSFDAIAVDGLQSLNDGIVDAIMGAKSLGDMFSNVAKQIIADLLRIAVQQMIIKPLLSSVGIPGFNGGGTLKLPGFASGGSMLLGGNSGIDKNVLSMNGRPIARVSKGEHMTITNPALTRAGRGGNVVNQTFVLDARGGITTPDLLQYVNNVAADKARQAGGAAYKQSMKDAPKAVGRANRYGA